MTHVTHMAHVTHVTRVADEVVKADGSLGRCELKHPPRRCFSWRSSVTWFKGSTRNQGSSQICCLFFSFKLFHGSGMGSVQEANMEIHRTRKSAGLSCVKTF